VSHVLLQQGHLFGRRQVGLAIKFLVTFLVTATCHPTRLAVDKAASLDAAFSAISQTRPGWW
jgi:transposase-like protein